MKYNLYENAEIEASGTAEDVPFWQNAAGAALVALIFLAVVFLCSGWR